MCGGAWRAQGAQAVDSSGRAQKDRAAARRWSSQGAAAPDADPMAGGGASAPMRQRSTLQADYNHGCHQSALKQPFEHVHAIRMLYHTACSLWTLKNLDLTCCAFGHMLRFWTCLARLCGTVPVAPDLMTSRMQTTRMAHALQPGMVRRCARWRRTAGWPLAGTPGRTAHSASARRPTRQAAWRGLCLREPRFCGFAAVLPPCVRGCCSHGELELHLNLLNAIVDYEHLTTHLV